MGELRGRREGEGRLASGSGGGGGVFFYRSSTTNWTTPTTNYRHHQNARSGTTNSLAFLHRFASHLDSVRLIHRRRCLVKIDSMMCVGTSSILFLRFLASTPFLPSPPFYTSARVPQMPYRTRCFHLGDIWDNSIKVCSLNRNSIITV